MDTMSAAGGQSEEGGGDLDLLVAQPRRAALPQRGGPSGQHSDSSHVRNAPRSEHGPELGAASIADIVLHPVTGAFADPFHESAFGAQF